MAPCTKLCPLQTHHLLFHSLTFTRALLSFRCMMLLRLLLMLEGMMMERFLTLLVTVVLQVLRVPPGMQQQVPLCSLATVVSLELWICSLAMEATLMHSVMAFLCRLPHSFAAWCHPLWTSSAQRILSETSDASNV